ncbi:MAG: hypothetical protein ACC742_02210, partial [Thermoanaerobaculales bacterium]
QRRYAKDCEDDRELFHGDSLPISTEEIMIASLTEFGSALLEHRKQRRARVDFLRAGDHEW